VRTAILLSIIIQAFISQCYSQSSLGCSDALGYGFNFYGTLFSDKNLTTYDSRPKHEFIVVKLDSILVFASNSDPACNFSIGELTFNSQPVRKYKKIEGAQSGWIKFKAREGIYSVGIGVSSSIGTSHTLTFEVELLKPANSNVNGNIEAFVIEEIDVFKKNIGPNPFHDILSFPIDENSPPNRIVIINSQAVEVYNKKKPLDDFTVNLGHLPQGIYIIRYIYAENQSVYRVLKK